MVVTLVVHTLMVKSIELSNINQSKVLNANTILLPIMPSMGLRLNLRVRFFIWGRLSQMGSMSHIGSTSSRGSTKLPLGQNDVEHGTRFACYMVLLSFVMQDVTEPKSLTIVLKFMFELES